MPERDSLLRKNGFHHLSDNPGSFGFVSYDQFRAWFYSDEFLEASSDYGIFLSVYAVDPAHVTVGNTQCVFEKAMAEEVRAFHPAESREKIEKTLAALEKDGIIQA